jgi:hypothetical protein
MAAEPESRHASADDFADQLEQYACSSRRAAPIALLGVTLLGIVGAGWWLAGLGRDRRILPIPPQSSSGGLIPTTLAGDSAAPNPSARALGPSTPVVAPLQVLSLDVERFRFDLRKQLSENLGTIGWSGLAARFGDEIRVNATLSEPAYCYLIAFNPDGHWQLCFPPKSDGKVDGPIRPPASDSVRYPQRATSYFTLTDGRGQQAFVLLAARDPLPPFVEWASRLLGVPWGVVNEGGVWIFEHGEILPVHPKGDGARGQVKERRPENFEALCRFLEAKAEVDAISAIAFPVE